MHQPQTVPKVRSSSPARRPPRGATSVCRSICLLKTVRRNGHEHVTTQAVGGQIPVGISQRGTGETGPCPRWWENYYSAFHGRGRARPIKGAAVRRMLTCCTQNPSVNRVANCLLC